MEKYKFDENNGLWYELQGDYYLPCLKLPEEEQYRDMGTAASPLSQGASPCTLWQSADQRQAEQLSYRY